jgi:hypothetical protein
MGSAKIKLIEDVPILPVIFLPDKFLTQWNGNPFFALLL